MPGGQLIVLVNDGAAPVDIACWTVNSESRDQTTWVAGITDLAPGAAVRLLADGTAMDATDQLSLYDRSGRLVDRTPRLADSAHDDRLWYRADGGSWRFGRGAELPTRIADARLAVVPDTC